MPPLPSNLRSNLEKAIIQARDVAEDAARAALVTSAVERGAPFVTMGEDQRRLRRALRAKARQLGGGRLQEGIRPLVEEIAYQQWHRMLFARFLAENDLLMHSGGVPVTLQECAELAQEEGAADAWELAARYASDVLPGIFPLDDPAVQVRFAAEFCHRLERILGELPPMVFTADDSLGWVYQFWQSKKKDEVNASEEKIGAGNIAAVTQLFTENYMVRFLLENSLGAWWAARHPDSPLVKTFEYLRFLDDGTPAAGTFPGWPDHAIEVTMMDPCGGSGHFIVVAFEMLRRMRMEEEGLGETEAADAVIRDNLFMLEIDPRCTQIATFNLLLTAWKAGGYRELPVPNIACSGIPVEGQLDAWLELAGDDERLRSSLERLYDLFYNAPTLGSLIDPTSVPLDERMFSADYDEVAPLLERILQREQSHDDPAAAVLGAAAAGVAKAAKLSAGRYSLVATNVPYLSRGKQSEVLAEFCERHHADAKADLATAFVERCGALTDPRCTYALVSPQNWRFLVSWRKMREHLLKSQTWNSLNPLGPGAFETISGEVVNVGLAILTDQDPSEGHLVIGVDAELGDSPIEKARLLRRGLMQGVSQADLFRNPDSRIALKMGARRPLLNKYADGLQGIASADYSRYGRCFWELAAVVDGWSLQQSTVVRTTPFGGREHVLLWEDGSGDLAASDRARIQGLAAIGKQGVAVAQMGQLPCTLYTGELFDNNTAIILPHDPSHLPTIWAFCQSVEFREAVRRIDRNMKVTNATLVKVPFDLARWQTVAGEAGPVPEPYSHDPTQWLFKGHPVRSAEPLQVAVARLLGYEWPEQEDDGLAPCVDADGIICMPAVAGEQPAAERLRTLLAAAYGDAWSVEEQQRLLADVGHGGKSLAVWLRGGFFIQHCKLFKNRPFIWHIWDGRKDGFSALVNYHKLDAANLDKLIYTYLGSWIADQRAERDSGVAGADGRLVAALELQKKLEAIRDGEPDYDIYVRWKPLHEQPIGWDPDLNDGVRLNIRPFVTAGVLRRKFTIHWKKDRGKNPDGSKRINDLHFTRTEKLAAHKVMGQ